MLSVAQTGALNSTFWGNPISKVRCMSLVRRSHVCVLPKRRRNRKNGVQNWLSPSVPNAIPAAGSRQDFRYPGEYNFNLREYMVNLDKPIGLTLAPDPTTGQIVVQQIHPGSPAQTCKLIQVGDILKKCSAVFGDEMWQALDIGRTKWAINARSGKVRLILERRSAGRLPVWYCSGKMGHASVEGEQHQLPVRFTALASAEEEHADPLTRGRCMYISFHRSVIGQAQKEKRMAGMAARAKRTRELRLQLMQAREAPEIEIMPDVPRYVTTGGSGSITFGYAPSALPGRSQNGAVPFRRSDSRTIVTGNARLVTTAGQRKVEGGGGAPQGLTSMPRDKRVIQVLPWLLVATGRLNTQDLIQVASQQGLDSLLELGLACASGTLHVRSSKQPPRTAAAGGPSVPPPPLSTPVTALHEAVASLHRLVHRRNGAMVRGRDHCCILLHCDSGMEAETATMLAAWMHWHGGMGLYESVRAAEVAMETTVCQDLMQESSGSLYDGARERASRVVLMWPYGGTQAEVSGELVGGWEHRVALVKCEKDRGCGVAEKGQFFLEVGGLRPGRYHYKYIVDGTWTVDSAAPRMLDASGNWNNWVEVAALPPALTKEDRLHMSRLEAAQLAFAQKLGLGR